MKSEIERLEKIKAVFIDIDGTLTNSKCEVTEETKNAIKKLNEMKCCVVLCSGRTNKDVCKYSKEVMTSAYAISSNGAQIYNYKTNKNLYADSIKYNDLLEVWKYCFNNKLELILNATDLQYGNEIFCSDIYINKKVIHNVEELKNIDIYQIIINSNNFYDMKKCINFILDQRELNILNYSRDYVHNNIDSKEPYYIFVNNKSINKGIAINKFLQLMNIEKEKTICFGDRINDITMFNNCGIGIAMDNSDEELKKIADYVTLSNNENGIAYFINTYVKK